MLDYIIKYSIHLFVIYLRNLLYGGLVISMIQQIYKIITCNYILYINNVYCFMFSKSIGNVYLFQMYIIYVRVYNYIAV